MKMKMKMKISGRTTAGLIGPYSCDISGSTLPGQYISARSSKSKRTLCTYVHVYIKNMLCTYTLLRVARILSKGFI